MTDNKNYRILCLGTNCLPRVITTLCGLKPRKADGEKTCPFDLAFFWDFDWILNFIDNEFQDFFDGVEYDFINNVQFKTDLFRYFRNKQSREVWKHEEATAYFIHEGCWRDKTKFIERYTKRIENFYEYLNDKSKKLYNVIAIYNPITQIQIQRLNSIITRYRPKNSFHNIVINISNAPVYINDPNTSVINFTETTYHDMFRADWVQMLEKHEKWSCSDEFYNKLTRELAQIIR